MNSIRQIYPQTHIQTIGPLMLLLNNLGFDSNDLSRVNRAYHFAMTLWAVNFQSSSRPFICHAVGTAAFTARNGGDLTSILAALLHAAYSTGDFGVRIEGVTRRKRRTLSGVIGSAAEDLVFGFHSMLRKYGTHWVRLLEERGSGELTQRERTLLFLRVCNDLDDISDLAFSSDTRRERIIGFVSSSIKLAGRIDRPDLAADLQAELEQYRGFRFLPDEVSQRHESGHIVVPPAFRKRLVPGLLEVAHRWKTTGSPRIK